MSLFLNVANIPKQTVPRSYLRGFCLDLTTGITPSITDSTLDYTDQYNVRYHVELLPALVPWSSNFYTPVSYTHLTLPTNREV